MASLKFRTISHSLHRGEVLDPRGGQRKSSHVQQLPVREYQFSQRSKDKLQGRKGHLGCRRSPERVDEPLHQLDIQPIAQYTLPL